MELARDGGRGHDGSALTVPLSDGVGHATHWRLEKRTGDIDAFIKEGLSAELQQLRQLGYRALEHPEKAAGLLDTLRLRCGELAARFHAEVEPYEVVEFEGNILVTVGIDIMWDLLVGAGGTVFNNANAHLGVGDSSTAEGVGQTDLQAAVNKLRKAMVASYPIVASPKVTFQSTFGSAEANFTWAEVGTFNAATGGIMLNRKVQALGTKSSGATWTLTEDITLT